MRPLELAAAANLAADAAAAAVRFPRLTPTGKTQAVRLIDVFALGPFMLWSASKLTGAARWAMLIAGALTIYYNGRNYLAVRQATGECGCLFNGKGDR